MARSGGPDLAPGSEVSPARPIQRQMKQRVFCTNGDTCSEAACATVALYQVCRSYSPPAIVKLQLLTSLNMLASGSWESQLDGEGHRFSSPPPAASHAPRSLLLARQTSSWHLATPSLGGPCQDGALRRRHLSRKHVICASVSLWRGLDCAAKAGGGSPRRQRTRPAPSVPNKPGFVA